jgi:hypothetical protein
MISRDICAHKDPDRVASNKPMSVLHRQSVCNTVLSAALLLSAFPLAAQSSQPEALQVLRSAVASEIQANHTDKSIWTYLDRDDTDDKKALYDTIETRQGTLRRLIELNGQPLSPSAAQDETQRIDQYVHDASAQARAHKNAAHDDAQAASFLQMLPQAFVWTVVSQNAEFITLSFRPNPKFEPPDTEARVMGLMGGQMLIARSGNRIRTLRGSLTEDVKFGYGFFGRLNAGGTFDIERREVGGGHWQITETHVHIGGKALLFHTIGQQEDEVKTEWKPSPDATLIGAAQTLRNRH